MTLVNTGGKLELKDKFSPDQPNPVDDVIAGRLERAVGSVAGHALFEERFLAHCSVGHCQAANVGTSLDLALLAAA